MSSSTSGAGSGASANSEAVLRRARSMTTRGPYLGGSFGPRTPHGFDQPAHHPHHDVALAAPSVTPLPPPPAHPATAASPRDGECHTLVPLAVAPAETTTPYRTPPSPPAPRHRRSSHDAKPTGERMYLIDVGETERLILEQEDTDGDFQITVKDMGPKMMQLGSAGSAGFRKYDIRGTYVLSNLLQELALAKDVGRQFIVVAESTLNENPVTRLSRMIATHFWAGLTRAIDRKGMQVICQDPKNRSRDQSFKIYVPYEDHVGQAYYHEIMATTDWGLQVHVLPPDPTPEYVKTLDDHPGILSLALHRVWDPLANDRVWRGVPFIVPGGRFNEMYGWDSYFETLGLAADGKWDMGKHMVDNFAYQIHHYGKILNANRSYYLTRSQPPFLTDMARCVATHWAAALPHDTAARTAWLRRALLFAVREYYTVWTAAPRFDPATGLSAYRTTGIGMPPETEASHFTHILEPYAAARGVTVEKFTELYHMGAAVVPELDTYFGHDRAVRESGHDTTYRFERRCANLLTVDLNALLYKYEVDIADLIEAVGVAVDGADGLRIPVADAWRAKSGILARDDGLGDAGPVLPDLAAALGPAFADLWTNDAENTSVPAPLRASQACTWESSSVWRARAARRAATVTDLMWDADAGLFYDYDVAQGARSSYASVTTTWALWSGLATVDQARATVDLALPLFEELGGLVSGTEASRGAISMDRPNRQWDYPFGWAPHQMLAWRGLAKYGFAREARRLAYRWLYTITKAFVDFNGTVPEKFDVVTLNHILTVEYGNVGTDFKYVPREGFGWMNASYQVGLTYLDTGLRRKLGVLSPPDKVFAAELRESAAATAAAKAKLVVRGADGDGDGAESSSA
ncbi:alpha,alpha-trehalase nth1 [Blastocladiella emersonii ATCC 22665]|nr:alpha,alpha-trehalase nth1 [Blastocladiella emersonii ATCC 22665]